MDELTLARVWAVMPVFRPDNDALVALQSVRRQVAGIAVVDDGSGQGADDILARMRAEGAVVEQQSDNLGIGAALNRGIALAEERGASHVLFVDQDSRLGRGFVEALLSEERRARARGISVGSTVPEFFSDLRQANRRSDGFLDAHNGIQSGMLVPIGVFARVGPMRADLFIDLVDTEFELRLRSAGLAPIAAPRLRLDHRLGKQFRRHRWHSWYRWMTLSPEVTLSAPFRYYYRLRNRLLLNRSYFWKAPASRAKETIADVVHFLDTIALAVPRRTMMALYSRAFIDGICGRGGRIPDGLAVKAADVRWRADEVDQA